VYHADPQFCFLILCEKPPAQVLQTVLKRLLYPMTDHVEEPAFPTGGSYLRGNLVACFAPAEERANIDYRNPGMVCLLHAVLPYPLDTCAFPIAVASGISISLPLLTS
jgi:hypothetical protein